MRLLRLIACAAAASLAFAAVAEAAAPVGSLKQFRVPTANSQPRYITTGSDGNRWFTESSEFLPAAIGRITPAGTVSEFAVDCNVCILNDIVQGPGGVLYFTSNEAILGRITTSGVQLASIPMPQTDVLAGNLAAHGDDIWITDFNNNSIWRYTISSGAFTQFLPPTFASTPIDVAVDASGIVWFTEQGAGQIGRLDPSGVITEIVTPVFPHEITIATDGQIWFTARFVPEAVGRLDPATNVVTVFPDANAGPQSIAAAPDGSLWFTQTTTGNVARIDNSGVITDAKVVKGSEPFGVTIDSAGNPWYTMMSANKLAEFQLR